MFQRRERRIGDKLGILNTTKNTIESNEEAIIKLLLYSIKLKII